MHRRVASLGRADGPGAAGVAGLSADGAVAPFAGGQPDRVDGWQVQHVEPHLLDVVQPRRHVGECAVLFRVRRGRAGEHLVPGAEASLGSFGENGVDVRRGGRARIGQLSHEAAERLGEEHIRQGHAPRRLGLEGPQRQFLGDVALEPSHPGAHDLGERRQ